MMVMVHYIIVLFLLDIFKNVFSKPNVKDVVIIRFLSSDIGGLAFVLSIFLTTHR